MNNFKILVKFPTRSRPEKFFKVLDLYISKANNIKDIIFLISCDIDDTAMNVLSVHKQLNNYQQKYNLQYFFENNCSKIQAINANIEKIQNWDILLLASDDMVPIVDGYDDVIRQDMKKNHPGLDGTLWYNDGFQQVTNTLSILGKTYYKRFNYIYHPSYKSVFCDNEYTEVAIHLNKCYKTQKIIIEHIHPAWNKQNYDDLYIKNEKFFELDKKNFELRKQSNFDL